MSMQKGTKHSITRHVILDRDGTLIRHTPYLSDPAQVELLPGVAEGLQRLRNGGCVLYLHTNQSGVGRGYFAMEDAVACNERMIALLPLEVPVFAEICIAPEHPDQPPVYRKPSPAFGRALMVRHGFAADEVCYVGDALSDLMTARNLGCLGIGVNTGEHDLEALVAAEGLEQVFPVVGSFFAAVERIMGPRHD
jgi:D-glycero-D-manno-heptose 1,7-bisphosphate phosphatase